jgi:RND superfamily putative drug exporter
MVLLGKRAWWMPGWLDRLVPHISIEGEEYFAKRDADLALAADGTQSEDIYRFESRRPTGAGD